MINSSKTGKKENQVKVIYTPASNLKKTGDMDTGEVGFYRQQDVKFVMVERDREIVKKVMKTKTDKKSDDLAEQLDNRKKTEQKLKNKQKDEDRMKTKEEIEKRKKLKEASSYDLMFESDDMKSNKNLAEDDFM